jgi:hypothetical protein
MITSIFDGDNRTVIADYATEFYYDLGCDAKNISIGDCKGSVGDFMNRYVSKVKNGIDLNSRMLS